MCSNAYNKFTILSGIFGAFYKSDFFLHSVIHLRMIITVEQVTVEFFKRLFETSIFAKDE